MTLLLSILVACAAPRNRDRAASADEAAIRTSRAAQNGAIATGAVDSAAGFWTEDVEIRRGLGQLIQGRDAYTQLITIKGPRDSALVYVRTPTTVVVSAKCPLAYESGTWAGHLGGANGPVTISGQYSAQWIKRADRWLIRGELFVALECGGVGCAYTAAP